MSGPLIATWNVNSVRVRLPALLGWLDKAAPDVVLLQETKAEDHAFPRLELESRGWQLALFGQKTYNGVAILSRRPILDSNTGLLGDPGEARYIEAVLDDGLRVASVYVPMGQSTASERFPAKLVFLDALAARVRTLLAEDRPFVIGGDFNVAPEPADVFDAGAMAGKVLFHPEERRRFRRLLFLGLADAVRSLDPSPGRFSWWDYRGGAFMRGEGLRIDHLLLSPGAADRLVAAGIDTKPREEAKCSDHAPVWCRLQTGARIGSGKA